MLPMEMVVITLAGEATLVQRLLLPANSWSRSNLESCLSVDYRSARRMKVWSSFTLNLGNYWTALWCATVRRRSLAALDLSHFPRKKRYSYFWISSLIQENFYRWTRLWVPDLMKLMVRRLIQSVRFRVINHLAPNRTYLLSDYTSLEFEKSTRKTISPPIFRHLAMS